MMKEIGEVLVREGVVFPPFGPAFASMFEGTSSEVHLGAIAVDETLFPALDMFLSIL